MNVKSMICGLALLFSYNVVALEEINHFEGKSSDSIQAALCNLKTYNLALQKRTDKKHMVIQDHADIHQITYTLEVAVQKLQSELAIIAEELEKVHKGSEAANNNKVKSAGEIYLNKTSELLSYSCN